MIYQRCPASVWPTLTSPGPLRNPERHEQCRKQLLLNRTGRACDKHMYAQILLWEFIQDSNKALSASSSSVIQRGAMPRKQDFPTTLIILAVQESSVSNSPSHTEIIIPLPLFQGGTMPLIYLIFYFLRKRPWLLS